MIQAYQEQILSVNGQLAVTNRELNQFKDALDPLLRVLYPTGRTIISGFYVFLY